MLPNTRLLVNEVKNKLYIDIIKAKQRVYSPLKMHSTRNILQKEKSQTRSTTNSICADLSSSFSFLMRFADAATYFAANRVDHTIYGLNGREYKSHIASALRRNVSKRQNF